MFLVQRPKTGLSKNDNLKTSEYASTSVYPDITTLETNNTSEPTSNSTYSPIVDKAILLLPEMTLSLKRRLFNEKEDLKTSLKSSKIRFYGQDRKDINNPVNDSVYRKQNTSSNSDKKPKQVVITRESITHTMTPKMTSSLRNRKLDEKSMATSLKSSKKNCNRQEIQAATSSVSDYADGEPLSAGCSGVQTKVSTQSSSFRSAKSATGTTPQSSLHTEGNIEPKLAKEKAKSFSKNQEKETKESYFESFGHQVANSLTQMSAEQQVIAVSLITDLLSAGNQGQLSW